MASRKVITEPCLPLSTRASKSGERITYTHPKLNVRMTFPSDWTVVGVQTILCGVSLVLKGAKEKAVVSVGRTDEFNLRTPLRKHMWDSLPGIETPIEDRYVKLNGKRAYK